MTPRLLQRPIYGGVFGLGLYSLASLPTVAHGLHAVRFMVIEPRRGSVLSVADNKLQALAQARRVLIGLPTARAANDPAWEQRPLWPEPPITPQPQVVRRISRRRREVFERSEGRCHYCHVGLRLCERWHVEHMLPKALGGDESPVNLVAACAPCNLAKSDRTALEFVLLPGSSSC